MASPHIRVTWVVALVSAGALHAQSPWTYSTYLGGTGNESGLKVAADRSGNTYVAGNTTSVGFPFTASSLGLSVLPRTFLFKLDASGGLVFAKTVEASLEAIAVDPEGNSYLAGSAYDGRFETTAGSFQSSVNHSGAFVMKVDSEGKTVFSTYFGNRSTPTATTVSFDAERNVIICGSALPGDIPLTEGAIQSHSGHPSVQKGFCAVLSADGARLLYSTLFGGSGLTVPTASLVVESGDLILTGYTNSTDFPLKEPFQAEDPRRMLFRFNRAEETWTATGGSPLSTVHSIGFGATQNQILLGTWAGAQVSEDGGGTWRLLQSPPGPVVAHPGNPKYLCAATPTFQLYCSTDGGQRWLLLIVTGARQVIADPKVVGGFYVATLSGLRYMPLAGAPAPHPFFSVLPVESIAIDASGENTTIWAVGGSTLHRSVDGGVEFERLAFNFSRVFVSPQSPGVLYGFRRARLTAADPWLVRSTDGGSSWTDIATTFEQGAFLDLAIDPQSPSTLFVASNGVYRSQDNGESWTLMSAGLTNGVVRTLQFDPAGNLWAGAEALHNGFVARLNLKERTIQLSTLLSGSGGATPLTLLPDSADRILVLGRTFSTDLPVTAGPILVPSIPYGQDFVAMLDTTTGRLLEMRLIGLEGRAFARDALGRLHVVGSSRTKRETVGGIRIGGDFQGGASDGLWTVLDLEASRVVQATWLGGSAADEITGVAVGPDGMVRLVGTTSSDDFPTANPLQPKRAGMVDGFLATTDRH